MHLIFVEKNHIRLCNAKELMIISIKPLAMTLPFLKGKSTSFTHIRCSA